MSEFRSTKHIAALQINEDEWETRESSTVSHGDQRFENIVTDITTVTDELIRHTTALQSFIGGRGISQDAPVSPYIHVWSGRVFKDLKDLCAELDAIRALSVLEGITLYASLQAVKNDKDPKVKKSCKAHEVDNGSVTSTSKDGLESTSVEESTSTDFEEFQDPMSSLRNHFAKQEIGQQSPQFSAGASMSAEGHILKSDFFRDHSQRSLKRGRQLLRR